MKPTHHIVISTGVSAAFWHFFGNVPATIICFLSGVLIDLDHHLDYFIINKKIPWRYKDLVGYCEHELMDKPVYLFLHGFEFQILLWMAIGVFDLSPSWVGLGLGMSTHLIADMLYNPIHPWGYLISFRASKGFKGNQFLTSKYNEKFHSNI